MATGTLTSIHTMSLMLTLLYGCVQTTLTLSHFSSATPLDSLSGPVVEI